MGLMPHRGSEAAFVAHPVGVAAGGDQQGCGDLGADAEDVQECGCVVGDELGDVLVQFVGLVVEVQPDGRRRAGIVWLPHGGCGLRRPGPTRTPREAAGVNPIPDPLVIVWAGSVHFRRPYME